MFVEFNDVRTSNKNNISQVHDLVGQPSYNKIKKKRLRVKKKIYLFAFASYAYKCVKYKRKYAYFVL